MDLSGFYWVLLEKQVNEKKKWTFKNPASSINFCQKYIKMVLNPAKSINLRDFEKKSSNIHQVIQVIQQNPFLLSIFEFFFLLVLSQQFPYIIAMVLTKSIWIYCNIIPASSIKFHYEGKSYKKNNI